jgi:hypothetical protein
MNFSLLLLLKEPNKQAGKRRQQQQLGQAGVPGPVSGPGAPAGALWAERRRSPAEQQQFRLQQQLRQQGRAKPQLQRKHSFAGGLLAM